jgi:hypothetical protein
MQIEFDGKNSGSVEIIVKSLAVTPQIGFQFKPKLQLMTLPSGQSH